jgi:hypothetical protein
MNINFLRKVLTVPLVLALVLTVPFFIYLKINVDKFIPFSNNTQYAYHDEMVIKSGEDSESVSEYEEDKNAKVEDFEKNQCIGVLRAGDGYPILFDMDYANIQNAVSLVKGSAAFGETGFAYIYSGNQNGEKIEKDKTISIGSVFGEKKYKFIERKEFTSEHSVLKYAPDAQSAVIVYYHQSKTAGFTSKYIALIYEEVK